MVCSMEGISMFDCAHVIVSGYSFVFKKKERFVKKKTKR